MITSFKKHDAGVSLDAICCELLGSLVVIGVQWDECSHTHTQDASLVQTC